MKRIRFLVPVVLFVCLLSACGPSAEEQARIEQNKEWAAQAEEIAPLLEAPLAGSYGADFSVFNSGGVIYSSVNVTWDEADREGFGSVCSLVGGRFLELVEEYPGYSFDGVSFRYYATNSAGKKDDAPIITYSLGVDGVGSYLEPGADVPLRQDMTPDDVLSLLSDN